MLQEFTKPTCILAKVVLQNTKSKSIGLAWILLILKIWQYSESRSLIQRWSWRYGLSTSGKGTESVVILQNGMPSRDTGSGTPEKKRKLDGKDEPPISHYCPGHFHSSQVLWRAMEKTDSDSHEVLGVLLWLKTVWFFKLIFIRI